MFGIAALELWASVPTGFALKLHPVMNCAAAILGASVGVIVVIALGDRARNWLLPKKDVKPGEERQGVLFRVWRRYGVAGLGLLAPLLVGAPLGAAIGIALGAPRGKFLFWMIVGVILWSALITGGCILGLETFLRIWYRFF